MNKVSLHPQVLLAYSQVEDGNMDYRFGTKKEVLTNRDAFFEKLGLNARDSIEGEQIHFDRLLALNEENSKMWRGMAVTGVDGFISNQIEIAMMVRVADCLPVALYDPVNHRAGLLHVGWRGAAKDFHLTGIERMETMYQSLPQDLLVWLGPSAQVCHFGFETVPEQLQSPSFKPFLHKKAGKINFDIEGYVASGLQDKGIKKSHLKREGRCTVEDPALFSHVVSTQESQKEARFAVVMKLL